jgi:hypothetical protein
MDNLIFLLKKLFAGKTLKYSIDTDDDGIKVISGEINIVELIDEIQQKASK